MSTRAATRSTRCSRAATTTADVGRERARTSPKRQRGPRPIPRWRFGLVGGRLQILALFLDQGADALGEQGDVEGLLERLAEAVLDELLGGRLVLAGQG